MQKQLARGRARSTSVATNPAKTNGTQGWLDAAGYAYAQRRVQWSTLPGEGCPTVA